MICHPWLAYKAIDWDAAFVDAVNKITLEMTDEAYGAIAQDMLERLGDPCTYVAGFGNNGDVVPLLETAVGATMTEDNIAIFQLVNISLDDCFAFEEAFPKRIADNRDAKAFIFDLRRSPDAGWTGVVEKLFNERVASLLCSEPVVAPARRSRCYSGWPQSEADWGYWFSGFVVRDGASFSPGPEAITAPIVFLINEYSELPKLVLALAQQQNCHIVSDTAVFPDSSFSRWIALPGGYQARLRIDELISANGQTDFRPDRILKVKRTQGNKPLLTAVVKLIRSGNLRKNKKDRFIQTMGRIPKSHYDGSDFPETGFRLLAAFRLWIIIRCCFAYIELIDESWDGALEKCLPLFDKAINAREYYMALSRMVSCLGDSHIDVRRHGFDEHFGPAGPAVQARFVENKLLVVKLDDDALKDQVSVGDIIVSIDGKDIQVLREEITPYFAASTPQALRCSMALYILNGEDNSMADITLEDSKGRTKKVKLLRKIWLAAETDSTTKPTEIYRIIPSTAIGYVDLAELTEQMVDDMFERLGNCDGIIFDMRGYPKHTFGKISDRLCTHASRPAAMFVRPVIAVEPAQIFQEVLRATQIFTQYVTRSSGPKYLGKTVMLINEYTWSQAEQTGLFLKSANDTVFIGSPSAGTNGTVTDVRIPGNISVSFTGEEIRWPDGSQLQRVGLQPEILVEPTIVGIRNGRDEVLEAAIAYLQNAIEEHQ